MAPASLKPGKGGTAPRSSKLSLMEDSDSDSDGGIRIDEAGGFKVNEEYARRFEHNKKREEKHKREFFFFFWRVLAKPPSDSRQVEEKYKKDTRRAARDDAGSDDTTSSSNETEDEDGFLATEDLDTQISATLHAIRNKDPRVYDKSVTFVQLPDDEVLAAGNKKKKEKPVFLRDYQREKLLRGDVGAPEDDEEPPQTYAEEQAALKKSIVSEMHATHGDDGEESDDGDDDDNFLQKKQPAEADDNGVHPSRATKLKLSELDVANADKNPEIFLSNFLASRAWIPEEGGKWKAFESDDNDGDDGMADEWEQAYNMRFEDPAKSNEVLRSYARDFAAARSVRREEKTARRRQRELERERKEEEKRERREEKARLRKLKLDEAGEKLRLVKQAAGAVGKQLREEEWMQFLDDAWDNDKWEEEMQRRFGDEYYALEDGAAESDEGDGAEEKEEEKKRKRKGPKKPRWDDDIGINDIIPDFEDEAEPPIILNDEGTGENAQEDGDSGDAAARPSKKRKTASAKLARRAARQERSRLEALVDSKLELSHHALLSAAAAAAAFRYRATSPQSFGLTARDILLAPSDRALNDFAGLKKLASFRDEAKKRRDRKRLGKKARLREWRRGTFGREFEAAGPTYGFEHLAADPAAGDGIVDGTRRKKRKRSKGKGVAPAEAA